MLSIALEATGVKEVAAVIAGKFFLFRSGFSGQRGAATLEVAHQISKQVPGETERLVHPQPEEMQSCSPAGICG